MGPKKNRNKPRNDAFYGRRQNQVAMFFNINDSRPLDPNIRKFVFQIDDFRQEVTNYTCALANGEQSGNIVIGQYADDNFSGYSYGSAEKDRLRLETIAAIKDVRPKIPGKDYKIQFVPFFDSHGKPQENTEFLMISVEGTRKPWQRKMYSNANREIYTFRDGNVREAKGYEIEEILRRRYQSEQDKLRNGFKSELGNLQAEKKRIEDSLQKYTEKFLNIKMKEFENTIDHRMGLSGGFKIDDTDREQTNSLGHSAAGESQRDDMKKYFERELKLFEEIVEQQKKELEDKQDALNRVMFELDNAKASDDYIDNEEDDEDNDKGGDANGQENASEDSVQNSSGKKKGKGKSSKACIVS